MGGGVEELVGDAEDVAVADGAEVVPVALLDDAGEGNAVAGAAPGEDEGVGVGGGDFFRGGVGTGVAEGIAHQPLETNSATASALRSRSDMRGLPHSSQ